MLKESTHKNDHEQREYEIEIISKEIRTLMAKQEKGKQIAKRSVYIRDEEDNLIGEENNTNARWKEYFEPVLNKEEEGTQEIEEVEMRVQ